MKRHLMPLLLAALSFALQPAQAAPFAKGDAAAGAKLHAEQCNACHAHRFNDDGSGIYTRKDRKAKSAASLAGWITTCNANLGNNLFPEDEANLGAFLNQKFYKFK
jgi:mono/diheme cytochrome c family protein